jgi:hypothetical protein
MPHHAAFDGNSVSTAMAFRNEWTALVVDLSFNDQRGERMTPFEFTPELRLRDGRVVRNSDDALEITRAAYDQTAGREEILHWLEGAVTQGQAATAKLMFVAWLQERGLIVVSNYTHH